MSTKFLSPGWRMPRNANQSKITNYSLDFDGTDHVNAGRILSAENTSTLSVSFWLKIPSTGAKSYLGYFIGNFGAGWLVEADSSSMYFVVGDTSYQAFTLPYSGNIAINTWYHIVMVYDGNQTGSANILKVYINGTQKTLSGSPSFPSSIPTLSGAEFTIGGIKPTSVSGVKSISSVSIFDYALSQSQVTTLWGGGTEVSNPMALPSTPVAYYPLGTSAWNGQYLAENNAIGDYVFDFENSNNHYISGSASLPNSDYTISAWINLETVTTESIVTWGEDATGKRRSLFIWNGGSGAYKLYSSTYGSNIPGSTTLLTGQWYHAAVTVSSAGVAKIYLNGSLDGTGTNILNSFTGNNFYIGRTPSSEYFDGKISNVQIFNTVLSGSEVETLYNYGSPIQTLANIPQSSNLKAWYKLDASEIYNSSSAEWSVDNNQNSSVYLSSLNFDGSSLIDTGTALTIVRDLTLSGWVKFTNTSSNGGTVISKHIAPNSQPYYTYRLYVQNNVAKFRIGTSTATLITGSTNINDGKWHHILGTYDGGNIKLYVDSVSDATAVSVSGDLNTATKKTTIGGGILGSTGSPSTSDPFIGQLSNAQVFNTALSAPDITSIYNNGVPLADMSSFSSLVSWWKLNNTTTGIEDSKGSNNGTNSGATEYAGFVNTLAGDSSGMSQSNLTQSDLQTVAPYSKYAMNFDGTNDYIDCGATVQQPTTNYSVSYWVKFDSVVGNVGIVGNFKTGVNPQVGFALTLSSGLNFEFWADGTANTSGGLVRGTSIPNSSTWYNVLGTYDGSLVKIYVNNVLENSVSYSATPNVTDQNLVIGRWYGNYSDYYTDGSISNVSVWNTALTSSQVREIYNEGLPSNLNNHSAYSNLVSWWQLGSNSSWNGNRWIVADEKVTNNGYSQNMAPYMPESGLTNGVGTTANGTSTGMSESSLIGDAPYSTANAISSGMAVTAIGTNIP